MEDLAHEDRLHLGFHNAALEAYTFPSGLDGDAGVLLLARRTRSEVGEIMPLSAERLSELIGLLYDCAIDPAVWEGSLETIRRDLGFHNAVLEVYALPAASSVLRVVTGPAPEYIAAMPRYVSEVVELWGGMQRMARYPLEEPIVASNEIPREALRASRYYREWLEPQGVFDSIAIPFVRDAETLGSVAMGRHVSAGDIAQADLASLRLIAPHFRRAVSINRLLKLQSIKTASFSATLDGLETAIVFVDEQMRVAYANTVGSALLAAGELIGISRGALRVADPTAAQELAAAVGLAVRDEAGLGRRGIGIPARRPRGKPAVIHVLPLRGGTVRSALMGQALAALFVTPEPASPALPVKALARLYDLTPTETRVMELVANGHTLVEASGQLGIALGTVRAHLEHVFGKTGCQRQADLAALANAFRAPG